MLPFLKQRPQDDDAIEIRKSDDLDKENDGLHAVAQDIIRAIETKDYKMLAEAIRNAFEIVDSEPHHEGEHLEDDEE